MKNFDTFPYWCLDLPSPLTSTQLVHGYFSKLFLVNQKNNLWDLISDLFFNVTVKYYIVKHVSNRPMVNQPWIILMVSKKCIYFIRYPYEQLLSMNQYRKQPCISFCILCLSAAENQNHIPGFCIMWTCSHLILLAVLVSAPALVTTPSKKSAQLFLSLLFFFQLCYMSRHV